MGNVVARYFGAWKSEGPKPVVDPPPVPANVPSSTVVPDTSRVQINATETLGALSLAQGANTITAGTGNSGQYVSADLTFASLAG